MLRKVYMAKSGEIPEDKELEESKGNVDESSAEDADDRELREAIAEEMEAEGDGLGVREIRINWNKAWTILGSEVKWKNRPAGEKIKQKLEELGITDANELLLCNRAQLDELCVHLKDIPRMSFYIAMNVRTAKSISN